MICEGAIPITINNDRSLSAMTNQAPLKATASPPEPASDVRMTKRESHRSQKSDGKRKQQDLVGLEPVFASAHFDNDRQSLRTLQRKLANCFDHGWTQINADVIPFLSASIRVHQRFFFYDD